MACPRVRRGRSPRQAEMDLQPVNRSKRSAADAGTAAVLRHWREAVPNDRLAHLLKDARRGLSRALQGRLARHSVSYGHWTYLRILWETDGLTQRELSEQAGVMEPTTFAALKAMEKMGYITRRQMPDDRKKVFIFLTARGRAPDAPDHDREPGARRGGVCRQAPANSFDPRVGPPDRGRRFRRGHTQAGLRLNSDNAGSRERPESKKPPCTTPISCTSTAS